MQKSFQFSTPPPSNTSFDIPIFLKTDDFYKKLYLQLVKFPKPHRYTLGQRLDNLTLEIFELFLTTNGRKLPDKYLLLEKASVKIDLLKLLLRLAKDTESLKTSAYIDLESDLIEIGKMLGGWLKHTKQIT